VASEVGLVQVGGGAALACVDGKVFLAVGREEDHRGRRMRGGNDPRRLDATDADHRDVHQNEIRME
jgi:hypothetical protein